MAGSVKQEEIIIVFVRLKHIMFACCYDLD